MQNIQMLKGKFLTVNLYIKKRKILNNNLTLYFTELEKRTN